ncbi:MAG: adenosine deaminase [Desulfovibrio sp.]|uniref:adenosine deaminase n=1 Tax=Desulfovibrio sp. TaxID=885 RepID=UPI001A6CF67E|nr:adenosine deaminase [Desulfovibrio sp.]MBD5416255.1 adenosine deaminase [Desulfovibrio sp.]
MPTPALAPAPEAEAPAGLIHLPAPALSAASRLADEAADAIAAAPKDYAAHARVLHDLKLALVELADRGEAPLQAEEKGNEAAPSVDDRGEVPPALPHADLVWDLARALPDFSTEALYQKRSSLGAMAGMAVFGWFLGGLASTVLGWLGLGGDILRAFGVWAMFWLSEYLSANPRARHTVLALLGMGALGRFAMSAMSGMLRLTSWGSIRQAIFGVGRLPNIFKVGWLLFGAFFVLVFLSKKITALDMTAFRHSLREQAEGCLRLAAFVLGEVESRDAALAELRDRLDDAADGEAPRRAGDALARDMLGMLDGLDPDARRFLLQRLAAAGYMPESTGEDWLVWQSERDAELYDTVGLVREGDRCRILRRAMRTPSGVTRGLVQRAPEAAGKTGVRP